MAGTLAGAALLPPHGAAKHPARRRTAFFAVAEIGIIDHPDAAGAAGGQRAQPDDLAGGDHTPQAREAARRVDLFFATGPAARGWATGIGLDDGRLRSDKAPELLIDALALLDAPPPAYLVGDGPLREPLTRLIRDRGLDAVVHLPGWSFDPARYIAGASVHVVPSREESWSQSAVLALGLGVPVIGTTVDGLALTLAEGRGVLVPPEDPRALASALSRVLAGEHPDPAPGRAYARQFTPSAAAAVYARAYRQLLASYARSGKSAIPQP